VNISRFFYFHQMRPQRFGEASRTTRTHSSYARVFVLCHVYKGEEGSKKIFQKSQEFHGPFNKPKSEGKQVIGSRTKRRGAPKPARRASRSFTAEKSSTVREESGKTHKNLIRDEIRIIHGHRGRPHSHLGG